MTIAGILALLLSLAFAFILISYLYRVVKRLVHISFTLGTILAGVRAIALQTTTVPATIQSVNTDLAPVQAATDALAGGFGGRV
jgi:uncharacterized membrane protein